MSKVHVAVNFPIAVIIYSKKKKSYLKEEELSWFTCKDTVHNNEKGMALTGHMSPNVRRQKDVHGASLTFSF